MSILLDSSTRVIVQGITGREGLYHTRNMKTAGTNIVGGVTPSWPVTTRLLLCAWRSRTSSSPTKKISAILRRSAASMPSKR